ncbi:DEAD/DEAH box helicase [archaeon]|nr:MAG: DEAD/DEAH box helicase [archaeon]
MIPIPIPIPTPPIVAYINTHLFPYPPGILVLAPTRELACQIEEQAVKFGRSSFIRSCCAYGGAAKGFQIQRLKQGIDVLIATPGMDGV